MQKKLQYCKVKMAARVAVRSKEEDEATICATAAANLAVGMAPLAKPGQVSVTARTH